MNSIWVAVINHRHGTDVDVFASEAGARKYLLDFAKDWWSEVAEEDEPMPSDDELVMVYFARQAGNESYVLDYMKVNS